MQTKAKVTPKDTNKDFWKVLSRKSLERAWDKKDKVWDKKRK